MSIEETIHATNSCAMTFPASMAIVIQAPLMLFADITTGKRFIQG
jgi:hypothetical protein